jgi:hypothetical protein
MLNYVENVILCLQNADPSQFSAFSLCGQGDQTLAKGLGLAQL